MERETGYDREVEEVFRSERREHICLLKGNRVNSREEETTAGVKPIYMNKGGSRYEAAGLFCNF